MRMTDRMEDFIRTLALGTNCEGVEAIFGHMGMNVSVDTITRILRRLAVICDGKTREAIEVLDGRDGEGSKGWLKKNKLVKKDMCERDGAYAKAITEAQPEVSR